MLSTTLRGAGVPGEHLLRKLSSVADTGEKAGVLPRGGPLAAGGAPMRCPWEQSPVACGRPSEPRVPDFPPPQGALDRQDGRRQTLAGSVMC